MARALPGAVLALALGVLVAPAPALAHAGYERSSPAAGAVVPSAPARLEVWFTQELFRRAGENTLEVTGPDGSSATEGEAVVDDGDRTLLWVALQPDLEPGEYTVAWRSLSAVDGDDDEGTFTFTIDPSAPSPTVEAPTAAAAAAASATPSEETSPAAATEPTPAATPVPGATASLTGDGSSFPWWVLIAGAAILGAGAIGGWALWSGGPGEAEG